MALKPRRDDILNRLTAAQYFDRLLDLALSRFEWDELPDSVDPRFLELQLVGRGSVCMFVDEVLGMLALPVNSYGELDVYNTPIRRTVFANNGYHRELDNRNSVIVYNNYTRTSCGLDLRGYAHRLWIIDRVIDVNVQQQRTPRLIKAPEKQLLTIRNILQRLDDNADAIVTDHNFDLETLASIDITAPFVADKLFALKRRIWSEAMTYLGLTANVDDKQERQIVQEVDNYNQSTYAQRFTALAARQDGVERINRMFGTQIRVRFRAAIEEAGRPAMEAALERRGELQEDAHISQGEEDIP